MKTFSSLLNLAVMIAALSVSTLGQTFAVPRELKIDRLVRQTFPAYFGRGYRYPALSAEGFFPIGWSKDGKFAYYKEPVDEACGCYYGYLAIQDLRTDKILWEFKYDQDDTREPGSDKMKGPGNLRDLWKANQKLFSQKLAENGIVASRFSLLGKTFAAAGRSYTARLVEKRGPNPDEYDDRVNYYTVSLSSPKLGSKTLFTSEDKTKEEYWFMLDAGLIGVLKSPYENRVAVLAVEVMRGYEGPPHTGEIRIVGADLTSGFGKK